MNCQSEEGKPPPSLESEAMRCQSVEVSAAAGLENRINVAIWEDAPAAASMGLATTNPAEIHHGQMAAAGHDGDIAAIDVADGHQRHH